MQFSSRAGDATKFEKIASPARAKKKNAPVAVALTLEVNRIVNQRETLLQICKLVCCSNTMYSFRTLRDD